MVMFFAALVTWAVVTLATPLSLPPSLALRATSASDSNEIDPNREPPQPQSTACGNIVEANVYPSQDSIYWPNGKVSFTAREAFDCLTSVPFNAAVATRFLQYYNQTLHFQSSLAYLKTPPTGYQQSAVDLLGGLQKIQNNVTAGVYRNQYAFEADVQTLVQSTHDTHITLYAGAMNAFTFAR